MTEESGSSGRAGVRRHVVQVLGDFGLGGDGRVARDLSTALAAAGARATCVALRSRTGAAPPAGPYAVLTLAADRGALSALGAAWRLRRFVAGERPDLLHVHGPHSLLFTAGALVGARRPAVWFSWHDSGQVVAMSGLRRASFLRQLRNCDRIFGSSKQIAERLRAVLPPETRVDVFRNGVAESPETHGMRADVPVVVWAGRIAQQKDPKILIRAAARLRDEGLRFRVVLAGKAPANLAWFEDEVRALVHELRAEDVVALPGWVQDVSSLWRYGAVYVQTSHTEGLSMALLEAMSAGLAVVATNVGDTSEPVVDGVTGLLIPTEDEDALCVALRSVLADAPLRAALGSAGRRRVAERFSMTTMSRFVLANLDAAP